VTRRGVGRRLLAASVVVALILAALNVTGLARYPGGPLREANADGPLWLDIRPSDQGSSSVGNDEPADWAKVGVPLYFGLLMLRNPWPWNATVEAITPVSPTPGLILDAVYVSRPGVSIGDPTVLGPEPSVPGGLTLDEAYSGLPAKVESDTNSPEKSAFTLVKVHSDQPGALGFKALAIDYRIGPFAFRAVQHLALQACLGPLPTGSRCPKVR
jgi:hypothetical protein